MSGRDSTPGGDGTSASEDRPSARYELVAGSLDEGDGHVDNTIFPEYVAEVRERFLRDRVGDAFERYDKPVVHLSIDYHAELFAGEEITATVRVDDVGTTSVTTVVELATDDGTAATATTVQVTVDPEIGETVRVPGTWRDGLASA